MPSQNQMHHARENSTGTCISVNFKLALTLLLLAGEFYLGLGLLYVVTYRHMYQIFHSVVRAWIFNDGVILINFHRSKKKLEKTKQTVNIFSNGISNIILGGCIGAIDGWFVEIKCSSCTTYGLRNASTFYQEGILYNKCAGNYGSTKNNSMAFDLM